MVERWFFIIYAGMLCWGGTQSLIMVKMLKLYDFAFIFFFCFVCGSLIF